MPSRRDPVQRSAMRWAGAWTLLLATVLASCSGAARRGPPQLGDVSPVLGVLDARETLSVVWLTRPDRSMAELLSTMRQLRDRVPEQLREMLSPANVTQLTGFDPTTPAGWASIGVDVHGGVAGALLDWKGRPGLGADPGALVLALRVTAPAKLQRWLSGH